MTGSSSGIDAIYGELPLEMSDAADWSLKMGEELSFPCHSFCLCAVSPVLSFALKAGNKDVSIPVPTTVSKDTVLAFLRWVYRLKIALTPTTAYELALLCHEWDVKGEQTCTNERRGIH